MYLQLHTEHDCTPTTRFLLLSQAALHGSTAAAEDVLQELLEELEWAELVVSVTCTQSYGLGHCLCVSHHIAASGIKTEGYQ